MSAGGECEIVVRDARAADAAARGELLRHAAHAHDQEAFFVFLFQELTLQLLVLGAAVLFIFVGVPATRCLALLPLAAAIVYVSVSIAHSALAHSHTQEMLREEFGLVAELRDPLCARSLAPVIRAEGEGDGEQGGGGAGEGARPTRLQVVGTVSLSEWRGAPHYARLHALAVHESWRGRGVGRALEAAARAAAARRHLASLEAVTSELQHAARGLLYSAGWRTRGAYHRRLCGAALTLALSHHALELPPPA